MTATRAPPTTLKHRRQTTLRAQNSKQTKQKNNKMLVCEKIVTMSTEKGETNWADEVDSHVSITWMSCINYVQHYNSFHYRRHWDPSTIV